MRRAQAGFTLVEALVTTVVIAAVLGGLMQASSMLFAVEGKTSQLSDSTRMTLSILENIHADPSQFQVNFAPWSVEDKDLLKVDELPLAYRTGYFGDASGCPACKIRLGYILRPMQGHSGLLRLIIRSYNTETLEDEMFYAVVTTN